MSNNKKSGGLFGKGYYIALILCAAAIGISGYVFYRNANRTEEVLQQHEAEAQMVLEVTEEDVPAVVTQPVTRPVETTPAPTVKKAMKTASPLEGETVASYAMDCLSYNSTTRDWRVHDGVDIAAAAGTEVKAAADGQVYTVYNDDTMGTTVVIRHEGGYVTVYASLAEEVAVGAGDRVTLGQTIGTVGTTALLENALGEHLHFGVLCNDEQVDPAEFLNMAS